MSGTSDVARKMPQSVNCPGGDHAAVRHCLPKFYPDGKLFYRGDRCPWFECKAEEAGQSCTVEMVVLSGKRTLRGTWLIAKVKSKPGQGPNPSSAQDTST